MNLLKTAEDLRNWEEYREFLKKQLKLVDGEGPCFVSKEKQNFEIDGKPWKGHAILVGGPKALQSMKELRKQGVLFREGTFRCEGKVLELQGLLPKLVKESAKTMLKLRLGWKVRGGEEEDGLVDDLEQAWNDLKARLAPHIRGALNGGIEAVEDLQKKLREAAGFEKTGDYASGIEAMKAAARILATGAGGAAAGAAAAAAVNAAAADQGVSEEEAKKNLDATGKSIVKDVGRGGDNLPEDVALVQRWLNNHGLRVEVSGECDQDTIRAILEYQRDVLKFKKPDGLVEARGTTERNLKRKPIQYDGEAETETEQKLKEFFGAFNGIPVRINPGQEPPQFVDVVPPYHINSGGRKKNALEAREENSAVNKIVKKLPALARVGKADPEDMKFFLEESIRKGLVSNKTQKGLRDFLSLYGVSTDCSGLVGQALNFLTDGDLENEKGDAIDSMNTGANSMKGGKSQFSKVSKPSALTAGDTMHTPGHIRIIVDVDRDGDMTLFRTIESTPREDVVGGVSDGKYGKNADGGVGDILWRYDQSDKLSGLQRSADDGKTWKRANDGNVTYGRWKKMPAA